MLRWALVFLIVALVAALLGFTGIAHGATWIAKVLCFLFAAAFMVFFVRGWVKGRPPRPIA